MNLLTVTTIDHISTTVKPRIQPRTTTVPLDAALNMVLAADVVSNCDVPHFRRSTVDGYAVLAADTAAAGENAPSFLRVVGKVHMGEPADFAIKPGECAYVPTGGALPEGADAVVMVEYCEIFGADVAIYTSNAHGDNVSLIGEDIRAADTVLKKGTKIRPQEVGALAAMGIVDALVYERPKIFIISTGDELILPTQAPKNGEIRDINSYALRALAEEHGFCVTGVCVIKDDEDALFAAISANMGVNDIIAISGGSSQGEKDNTKAAIARAAASPGVLAHGVAIKPGKPTIIGYDDETETALIGLPGHPVSAMVVFRAVIAPLYNVGTVRQIKIPAKMATNVPSSPGKTTFQLVTLEGGGGQFKATPIFGKSGAITTLTKADGFVEIHMNKEGLNRGEEVVVELI